MRKSVNKNQIQEMRKTGGSQFSEGSSGQILKRLPNNLAKQNSDNNNKKMFASDVKSNMSSLLKSNKDSPERRSTQKKPVVSDFNTNEDEKGASLRCPKGYTKLGMVGQGGSAMVWLAESVETIVALKQFPKTPGQDKDKSI